MRSNRITAAVAVGGGTTIVKTRAAAPNCNAICERFLGSVRRECLDDILILSDGHLRRTLRAYCEHFNAARPHQGIGQRPPPLAPLLWPVAPGTRATLLNSQCSTAFTTSTNWRPNNGNPGRMTKVANTG